MQTAKPKNGLFSRIVEAFKTPQDNKSISKRAYNAALTSRLNSAMRTSNTSIDQNIFAASDALRSRSRNMADNDPYMVKFLNMVKINVVGPEGFNFQALPLNAQGEIDRADARAIELSFNEWMESGNCEVTGALAFADVATMFITSVAREGESLIRKVRGSGVNRWGFALQMLDIDRLDIRLNASLGNGNVVRMGVEINTFGKPVAYHLRSNHPGESLVVGNDGKARRVERVLFTDIYHKFIPLRAEQRRGVPWAHAVMTRLDQLASYEEAAIVAARVGASKMGFFYDKDGEGASALADDEDDDGEFFQDAEAGTFGVIPKGYEFQEWSPEYPHQGFDSFVKATLRGAASGLGISYNSLANDLEGVNFSSIRSGVLEERDAWMGIQNWMSRNFLTQVYYDWLEMALLNSAIVGITGIPLPATRLQKFRAHKWQGRRWAWVDPYKDAQANALMIREKLKSRQKVIAEGGDDIDDVWVQLQKEDIEAAKLNLSLTPATLPDKPTPEETTKEEQ